MKAMILAAGLGTRLKPLTDTRPKALVKIKGKTLLEITIDNLISFGFNEFIINTYHFSEMMIGFIKSLKKEASFYISDESERLLDTGGGIKKARHLLEEDKPFLVHNVDVLSPINFSEMMSWHNSNKALATLAVSRRESSRYLWFDENSSLSGWENRSTGEKIDVPNKNKKKQFAFSGVHIISPDIFELMPKEDKFSIVNLYLKQALDNNITCYEHSSDGFIDVGNPDKLKEAEKFIE